jgi:serine/threonine-protein kinase
VRAQLCSIAVPVATPVRAASQGEAVAEGDYAPGDLIGGKYRLDALLGEGGMGSVWCARNMTLHADVAIKLVRRGIASAEAAHRLLDEARAAAQIDHPCIVRMNDFGETERGDPFIVMEMLKGESLGATIAGRGRLPGVEAVQIVLPVLSALGAVHQKGIIHRDIKPDNILLVESDAGEVTPKLVDFGIARLPHRAVEIPEGEGALAEATAFAVAARLTQTGQLVGSPTYMAPEQARGDMVVDARADLWGISIVLYEAVTGVVPFDDPDYEKVLIALLVHEPRSFASRGVGEPELWEIVKKGLAKQRGERWQSARAFGEELARWLLSKGVDIDVAGRSVRRAWLGGDTVRGIAPLVPRPRSRAPLVALGGLLAAAALGAAWWLAVAGREPASAAPSGPASVAPAALAPSRPSEGVRAEEEEPETAQEPTTPLAGSSHASGAGPRPAIHPIPAGERRIASAAAPASAAPAAASRRPPAPRRPDGSMPLPDADAAGF